jgi:hypothetical protein
MFLEADVTCIFFFKTFLQVIKLSQSHKKMFELIQLGIAIK